MVEGLTEVMPWVRLWHHEVGPPFGRSPAVAYVAHRDDKPVKYVIGE